MKYTQKQLERARIAVGLNPLDPEADPLPRAAALKAWHTRWDAPSLSASGSYYKSLDGLTQSQRALGYRTPQRNAPTRPRKRIVPIFSREQATNHALNNSIVDLYADGESIYAGAYAVKSISSAGVDRYGRPLVELVNDAGARYLVDKSALHLKD